MLNSQPPLLFHLLKIDSHPSSGGESNLPPPSLTLTDNGNLPNFISSLYIPSTISVNYQLYFVLGHPSMECNF